MGLRKKLLFKVNFKVRSTVCMLVCTHVHVQIV